MWFLSFSEKSPTEVDVVASLPVKRSLKLELTSANIQIYKNYLEKDAFLHIMTKEECILKPAYSQVPPFFET